MKAQQDRTFRVVLAPIQVYLCQYCLNKQTKRGNSKSQKLKNKILFHTHSPLQCVDGLGEGQI